MGRTVDVKDYFVHNFIAFQETYNCDIYIFNSLNKKTNQLNICGWITKAELLKMLFFKKRYCKKKKQ